MSFDVNVAIFVIFLTITLAFGLYHSRGVNTIKSYSIGNRSFNTATLVMTIVATWVGGEFFFGIVYESYTKGLNFILPSVLSDLLWPLFIGVICAPRMAEFLGKVSIAEAMGDLYGKNVRLITAVAGCIGVIGIISMQLKVAGVLFENALNIQGFYGVVSAGVIVTLYASLGGIKSVTFTDVVQFATFGIVIPALVYFLFYGFENNQLIIDTINESPLFNYKKTFDFSSSSTYYTFFLFIYFIIPSFNPAIFQRIAMAKSTKQVQYSFMIAAVICFVLSAVISWIAVLVLSVHPNLEEGEIFKTILADSAWIIGFKGLILAGIMAMVMSTVDSYINSSAVLLIHDLRKLLGFGVIKTELLTTRICAIFIGFVSIFFSMSTGSFVQLFMWVNMFYMPVVSVPFIFTIFGFRSSGKSVLIGMIFGFTVAIIWEFCIKIAGIDGVIPGMFANLVALLGSHYLLKQPGGWVGIKEPGPLLELRQSRQKKVNELKQDIAAFSLIDVLIKNTPKGDGFIALTGGFIMISSFSTISALPNVAKINYAFILDVFYPVTLCFATGLMSYPLWLDSWRKTNFVSIFWNIIIFFILICFNFFTVLISNFAEMQLMVFMINIIIVSCLLNWRLALSFIVLGIILTLFFYNFYSPYSPAQNETSSLGFKIVYLLFLISSTLIIFLKPKQEYLEATEQKARNAEKEAEYTKRELQNILQGFDFLENQLKQKEGRLEEKEKYLRDQLKLRNREIIKLTDIKDEFLRNVEHEFNTPLTGVLSLCDVVYSCYDKLDETMIKRSMKDIVNSGDRLKTYINSIIDVSKLSAAKCELKKEDINLSKLAKDRPTLYKKIFPDETEKQEFIFDIEDNIIVNCDEYYITQVIDNLISNAVSYGKGNPITISLKKTKENKVRFDITDQGIGIPETELLSIFTKFKVSSKTWTPAGGRGVGLALCQSAIEAHGGTISAESKEDKGSTFTFILALFKYFTDLLLTMPDMI